MCIEMLNTLLSPCTRASAVFATNIPVNLKKAFTVTGVSSHMTAAAGEFPGDVREALNIVTVMLRCFNTFQCK
jgi:hypothetical protein